LPPLLELLAPEQVRSVLVWLMGVSGIQIPKHLNPHCMYCYVKFNPEDRKPRALTLLLILFGCQEHIGKGVEGRVNPVSRNGFPSEKMLQELFF
jgi:hypothetical protein